MKDLKRVYEEPHMTKEQVEIMKRRIDEAKMENRREERSVGKKIAVTAAAVAAAFIILPNTSAGVAHAMESIPVIGKLVEVVTFRDYKYEDERHMADVEIPEIVPQTTVDETAEVQENLKKTAEEINAEIQEKAGVFVTEFEENLKSKEGYQDIIVKSEVIATSEKYFTLKLICYQGAGSGAEWNYYYTIDMKTGERLELKDLFKEGADYITAISENIKAQMKEQMEADEAKQYWLDSEIEEWNFKQITDETAFYVNEAGNVVISFNEGDVAPMYMGVVTFEIPAEVTADIMK